TPRLLAKWAGRMLRTRTNSSRISWVSCTSCSSVSPCRSAGDWIVGRIALLMRVILLAVDAEAHGLQPVGLAGGARSSIPLQHVLDQGREAVAAGPQGLQVGAGLLAQPLGAAAALGHAQEAGVRQLTAGGVLLHALSRLPGVALDVEQVVGDLERL